MWTRIEMNANELYQRLVEAGDDWADKQAAYNVLEDTKNAVLARLTLGAEGASVSAREIAAKASPEYAEHIKATQDAMKLALKAKVKYHAIQTWIDLARSQEATRRAEMKI